jgi:hypothetical protein
MWEIIEHSRSGKSHHEADKEVMDAYKCGYEEGFEDAMKEMGMHHESHMGERSYRIRDQYTGRDTGSFDEVASHVGSSIGHREHASESHSGYRGGAMGHREFMRETMREVMSERRSRDAMGRYK